MGKQWKQWQTIFLGSKITADGDSSHEIKRRLLLGRKVVTNLDSILKSTHYFANKDPSNQSYGFSSNHLWMFELDYKESWVLKNWCFWTVVLEKILRVPWIAKIFNQSILKEASPEYSLKDWCWSWNSNTLATRWKNFLTRKDPDDGKDWRQEEKEKGTTEDEMIEWHHWLNGHE